MKDKIVDFIVINNSPWFTESPNDPIGLIVLLENNLVVIDLKTEGYPQFQHHHPINLHESPITTCLYLVDPNKQLFQNLITSKEKLLQNQKQNLESQISTIKYQNNSNLSNTTSSTQFFSTLVSQNYFKTYSDIL